MYDLCLIPLHRGLDQGPCNGKITRLDFDQTQSAFTCSKLTIETLELDVKYVQS